MTLLQVEISLTVIISLVAISLSAYSIMVAKKRSDNTDLKEMTALLTELRTKMTAVEHAVLGKPSLNELVAVHDQKINDHGRRITSLEDNCVKRREAC